MLHLHKDEFEPLSQLKCDLKVIDSLHNDTHIIESFNLKLNLPTI